MQSIATRPTPIVNLGLVQLFELTKYSGQASGMLSACVPTSQPG